MGGCLLVDKFAWGSTMFAINATPPDPALVGDKWRDMWLERLEGSGFWLEEWHSPPAPRRVLQARLDLRGLFGDPVPGLSRRRLGGRLLERDLSHAREAEGAAQGPGRAVGAQVSAFRLPRPADRLPAGVPALVGQVAEGHRDRRDGRADAARLHAGSAPPGTWYAGTARALGGGGELAEPAHHASEMRRSRRDGSATPGTRRRGSGAHDLLAADGRARTPANGAPTGSTPISRAISATRPAARSSSTPSR